MKFKNSITIHVLKETDYESLSVNERVNITFCFRSLHGNQISMIPEGTFSDLISITHM